MSVRVEKVNFDFAIDTSKFDDTINSTKIKFDGLKDKVEEVISSVDINSIISIFGTLIPLITSSEQVMSALSTAFSSLAGPIGLIVGAIAALILGLSIMYKNNEEFANKVNELWERLKENFISIWESIKLIFEPIILSIKEFWDENGEEIVTSFMERFDAIANFINQIAIIIADIFNMIAGIFSENGTMITEALTATWDIIYSIIGTAIETVTGIINVFSALLKGDFLGAWNALVETVGNVFSGLVDAFLSFYELIKTFTDEIIAKIINVYENVIEFFTNFKEKITVFFQELPNKMKEFGRNIVQGLIDGIKQMINKVVEVAKKVVSAVTDKVKGLLGINSPSRVMINYGVNTGEGFILGIKQTFGKIDNVAKSMSGKIASGVSGLSSNLPNAYYSREQTNNFSPTLNVNADVDNLKYLVEINRIMRQQAALVAR